LNTPATERANEDFVTPLNTAIADHSIGKLAVSLRPRFKQYRALQAELIRYRRLVSSPPESSEALEGDRRVRQIEMALERLRWLPHTGDSRLLVVNIPMFTLWAWDVPPDGPPTFATDVIVGRAARTQTPIFTNQMREVIFRPYWNIPPSILRHEVLPLIERKADYLAQEDMEIVRGERDDSEVVEATKENIARLRSGGSGLRVRQRPGPKNALGFVKFVFPNEMNIYMHGTPARELFTRSRRDFSHGCIRVRDPVGLAEWALRGQAEWDRERILAAMEDSTSRHVKLMRPIRVVLFYSTAAVMPDGSLRFADDIYGHDATLELALADLRAHRSGQKLQ